MPKVDAVPDNGIAELVEAVKRLLAFRHAALRDPRDMLMRCEHGRHIRDASAPSSMMRFCLDDPAWHRLEEALRKTPPV